jgi:hypothetical protein
VRTDRTKEMFTEKSEKLSHAIPAAWLHETMRVLFSLVTTPSLPTQKHARSASLIASRQIRRSILTVGFEEGCRQFRVRHHHVQSIDISPLLLWWDSVKSKRMCFETVDRVSDGDESKHVQSDVHDIMTTPDEQFPTMNSETNWKCITKRSSFAKRSTGSTL